MYYLHRTTIDSRHTENNIYEHNNQERNIEKL